MFERFSSEARQAVVQAQEEARRLQHNYIGTEHLLLGLLAEPDGIAARAAGRFGLNLSTGRDDVIEIIGVGQQQTAGGHIPFTPRAKKCLELALREALQLSHDYIGSEHVLLGIIREGKGVGAQVMVKHGGDLAAFRTAVTDLLPPPSAGHTRRWARRRPDVGRVTEIRMAHQATGEMRTTPAADSSLAEAARLAGQSPVGSHHILLASVADVDSAAARALAGLGMDLSRVREALRAADVTGSTDELPEEAGRRQLVVTVTSDRVTVEAADPAIVALGRAAVDALGERAGAPSQPAGDPDRAAAGVIRGDDPLSSGLSMVWQALHDSLEDIQRRAGPATEPPDTPPAESAESG
jgi:ATP-dependent Clp protease ATP-binding subunit ClpC